MVVFLVMLARTRIVSRHLPYRVVLCGVDIRSSAADGPPTASQDEPWLEEEHVRYQKGKIRLAKMMGADPSTFTDKDVSESLRYLLPTSLSARDARPFLKDPSEVFPKRKESLFGSNGRPLEAAFFTGSPAYHNLIYSIYRQMASVEHDNTAVRDGSDSGGAPSIMNWVKKETMSNILAEELSDEQYKDIIERLKLLSTHESSPGVRTFLDLYRYTVFAPHHTHSLTGNKQLSNVEAVGKRKTSTAVVRLELGEGKLTVNSRPFLEYFPRREDREQVLYPLLSTATLGRFNINVQVKGGGTTGQAGATRLGLSKALLLFPDVQTKELEESGLLVRDPRAVERKKPGQKKARKKFAWVKR